MYSYDENNFFINVATLLFRRRKYPATPMSFSSQRGSKSFNLCVERFCRSIGAPVDEEVRYLFVMFIYGSGNCIERLESALGHPVVLFG
jgi:hypothetical protein